jgi:hypothetical protein
MTKTWRDWNGDPYGTHIPLLRMIGMGGQIKTVLELGMGEFSTSLFLDRSVFQKLEVLHSIESNKEWADKVYTGDLRHRVTVFPEPIEKHLDSMVLGYYDLIFVDNSTSGDRRMATLRYLSGNIGRSLMVAHDIDVYEAAVDGSAFIHCVMDTQNKPWTALFWK